MGRAAMRRQSRHLQLCDGVPCLVQVGAETRHIRRLLVDDGTQAVNLGFGSRLFGGEGVVPSEAHLGHLEVMLS